MMDGLSNWYQMKTVREQRLLLVATGLLAVVLSWLLIIRPASLALENAKERHDSAVIARAQVQSQVEAIVTAQRESRARPEGSISDIVDRETARVGFDVTRTEAVGANGVRVIVDAVRPQTFFAWVSDLELRRGLDVDALTARPNSDETLAVDITFSGGR